MPIGTFDRTPPLVPMSSGGVDVPADAEVEVVPAAPGRIKVIVVNASASGVVWLGLDQTAQAGVGLPLGPGGGLEEFTSAAVRVVNPGSTAVHVSWQEFGA
jgi:hypothetical protein